MHVVNSSLMVAFGGSVGNGDHANDLLIGRPNRLARADAAEAEADLVASAEEGGVGDNEVDEDASGFAGDAAANGVAAPVSDDEDEEEMVVVRTIRTSDKLKKGKKRGKKRSGRRQVKDEL